VPTAADNPAQVRGAGHDLTLKCFMTDSKCDSIEAPTELSRRSFIALTSIGAAGSVMFGSAITAAQTAGNDVTTLTLQEAADQLRRKRLSPVELTQACLARIERLNPALNAFITVSGDFALASARTAETEIQRGRWRGPLHGIPIALKDLFDTAGVRTTAASALFKDRIPTEDAAVVRKLKDAGAVLLGKTNMHEFAYGATSAVSYFGAVRNPWSAARVSGGSSGGSAVAVAAGLCFAALGSDTAASIRQPAAYCGIVGLKPTYGLVSARGVIPLSWTFDHVGPLARTVADSALLLQAIAGYDPLDVGSRSIPIPDYNAAFRDKVSSIRVGVARTFFFADLDTEIDMAVNEALRVIERITARLRDVMLPGSTQALLDLRATVRAAEAYAYHEEFVKKSPELYQAETLTRLRTDADVNTPAYVRGRRQVEFIRRSTGEAFESVDVIVTPTTPVPPPLLADVGKDVDTSMALGTTRTVRNTAPFNLYGWPTISVPCGFTRGGLPIGLQISGPTGAETSVLRLARAYEQATDWHSRRPAGQSF
jgi:aspartyl-tRNA(Asn)/glutamyl-tRNA(Gln) amidotransferase subunit A